MTTKATKIYVGNIPDNCSVDQLSALFGKYGRIKECDIVKNYAFVHMSTNDEAKIAIEKLNGHEFMGNKITTELSHSKVRTKPGMGGKSQCYRCGKVGHWSKECPRNSLERVFLGSLRANRFSPYGSFTSARSRPPVPDREFDRYEPFDYYRDYLPPFERFPLPEAFERRPSPEYFRRLVPPEPFDQYYERRIREKYY